MRRGERLQDRRREALERQTERDERGDAGQLRQLERGKHGHCKEATRLRERIDAVSAGHCPVHLKYQAKRKPSADCELCRALWEAKA